MRDEFATQATKPKRAPKPTRKPAPSEDPKETPSPRREEPAPHAYPPHLDLD